MFVEIVGNEIDDGDNEQEQVEPDIEGHVESLAASIPRRLLFGLVIRELIQPGSSDSVVAVELSRSSRHAGPKHHKNGEGTERKHGRESVEHFSQGVSPTAVRSRIHEAVFEALGITGPLLPWRALHEEPQRAEEKASGEEFGYQARTPAFDRPVGRRVHAHDLRSACLLRQYPTRNDLTQAENESKAVQIRVDGERRVVAVAAVIAHPAVLVHCGIFKAGDEAIQPV